ncbi:hypothetical protein P261_02290 [Lachnospiraceae bacterium TWA4]|nr:hypothetical protein P261_02290 [Lachnospiraceae bacterium TWA4]
MIYDGEYFYVHTNYKGSLYVFHEDNKSVFCTVPLDDNEWTPVKMNTLLAYREGNLVFTGTDHGNTHVDNEENMKFLYQIFAQL